MEMDPRDFQKPSGQIVQTAKGHPAFVPNALPPQINYSGALVGLLSEADTALAELSATGRHLPNPHLLIAPYLRREAVLSSKIEGTHTNLSDLLLGEIDDTPSTNDDANEVRNYVKALEKGIQLLGTVPLSLRLVRELHTELMQGVRGSNKTPGEFRKGQNIVGSKGQDEATASYVPPPAEQLVDCLTQWETYLNNGDRNPLLIKCALQHVQFETIHPFWDGNGRVGRLLITLYLMSKGKLSQPLLYLSGYFDEHRQDYYQLLQRTRTHAAWEDWLLFFLTGVKEIATEAARQAKTLVDLREGFRAAVIGKPKALALIDHLFNNPYISVSRARRILEVTPPTASSAIKALQEQRILVDQSGRSWGRVFVAPAILDAISERRETLAPTGPAQVTSAD